MNIQDLQLQVQKFIDANPRPRVGFGDIVLLDKVQKFNRYCLDYMECHDIPSLAELDVVVYSKTGCSRCDAFKQWLDDKGVPYTPCELDKNFTKEWLQDKFRGVKTYPVVTVNGEWYRDLMQAKMYIYESYCYA